MLVSRNSETDETSETHFLINSLKYRHLLK